MNDPTRILGERFGIGMHGIGPAGGGLAAVRVALDEAILRAARAHAPPEILQPVLAPLQVDVEGFLANGGKRIRALSVLSAYAAFNPTPCPQRDPLALDAAAALEVLHGFMLAHDDVVDQSEQRRGAPTLHRRLARSAAGDADAPIGADLALIAGDLLFALANRVMYAAPWPEDVRGPLLADWCRMVLDTGYGQWADTLNDRQARRPLTPAQILEVARAKTAWYTLAGPMRIGARLGGAGEDDLARLDTYGAALGTAFQFRDDVIDLCDGKRLGKDVADDLRRGRVSVPVAIALERCSPSDRERLRALCSGEDGVSLTARRAWVLQLLDRTDALSATCDRIDAEVATALDAIAPYTTPQAHFWRALARGIAEEARAALGSVHRPAAPAMAVTA